MGENFFWQKILPFCMRKGVFEQNQPKTKPARKQKATRIGTYNTDKKPQTTRESLYQTNKESI